MGSAVFSVIIAAVVRLDHTTALVTVRKTFCIYTSMVCRAGRDVIPVIFWYEFYEKLSGTLTSYVVVKSV